MKYDTESYKLPSQFRLGGAYTTPVWTARVELVSPNNESAKVHFGGEYGFDIPTGNSGKIQSASFVARAGYAAGYDTRSWSAGFGIGVNRFEFDYAFVPYDDDLGDTHRFGLLIFLQ